MFFGVGLSIAPGRGQSVNSLASANCLFDTCNVNGVTFRPTKSGSISQTRMTELWASNTGALGSGGGFGSNGKGVGFLLDGSGGSITETLVSGSSIFQNNWAEGLKVLG